MSNWFERTADIYQCFLQFLLYEEFLGLGCVGLRYTLIVKEQDKSSDIEQQPPMYDSMLYSVHITYF